MAPNIFLKLQIGKHSGVVYNSKTNTFPLEIIKKHMYNMHKNCAIFTYLYFANKSEVYVQIVHIDCVIEQE